MKRIALIGVALLLLLGAALIALRFVGRGGRGGPGPSPTAGPGGGFPGPGGRETPFPEASPTGALVTDVCPSGWEGLADGDGDGLPDTIEARYLTNEAAADTDSDGFSDGDEVRAGYDPRQKEGNPRLDSDGDGLLEHEECQWKTDPFTADTDGDGFPDGAEVKNEFDPTIKGDGQGSDALPSRRAQQTQAALNQLRPDPNSPNYTEGLAGILTQEVPTEQLRNVRVTPEQVREVLSRVPVSTALPDIPLSELKVGSSNTGADVRQYLDGIDRLRPSDLGDAATLANALTASINGDLTSLRSLRARINTYEQAVRGTSVPPSGVEYHRTLIAVTRFVNDRLGEVDQAIGGNDPARAVLALRALQLGLPGHIQTLERARGNLASLAQ